MQNHELTLQREYPSLLLADRLNPITSVMSFVELDHDAALDAFLRWRRQIQTPALVSDYLNAAAQRSDALGDRARETLRELTDSKRSVDVPRRIDGGLASILRGLLPLANLAFRYAVVPTASGWTAFFDNGHKGPDLNSAMASLSRREGCRHLVITADPNEIDGRRRPAVWLGGVQEFNLRGPEAQVMHHPAGSRLLKAWVADGGRWRWDELGEPLPFERPELYTARRKKDRLPVSVLREYAAALGLRPFDADFYAPGGWGTIVTREGWIPPAMWEVSLDEVQARIWSRFGEPR